MTEYRLAIDVDLKAEDEAKAREMGEKLGLILEAVWPQAEPKATLQAVGQVLSPAEASEERERAIEHEEWFTGGASVAQRREHIEEAHRYIEAPSHGWNDRHAADHSAWGWTWHPSDPEEDVDPEEAALERAADDMTSEGR